MPNSPIQIVLNSSDFIQIWDRPPGGSEKDFYEGRDKEFVEHKEKLSKQLGTLKSRQLNNEYSEISFAKIIMKQSALAKSHRPTGSVFQRNVAPMVGAGDLGEIFIELSPSTIDTINSRVMSAEDETRYKENPKKDNKLEAKPTALRSEVGAIDEILPYTAADKRKFSLPDALEWLSDPKTGGAYIVELFETPPQRQNYDSLNSIKRKLFTSFREGLSRLGNGLVVSRIIDGTSGTTVLSARLEDSSAPPNIQLDGTPSIIRRQNAVRDISTEQQKHATLLKFLDDHPLVKKIVLPPVISRSAKAAIPFISDRTFSLPEYNAGNTYPKVAIVDGGVSSILGDWIEDRWGFLSTSDKDEDHGTFIGGLLVSGSSINGTAICKEMDGCKIIDLDILPVENVFADYFIQPLEFFRELEIAVKELKARTGVRIFNFSLNVEEHVSTNVYSHAAQVLDRIAEENDIIFVISAGNTGELDFRKEWPEDPAEALSILASSRNDILKTPSESCRNLSVAALNPPNLSGIIPYAPSNYSCRGPGIRVGIKPDLAHIGGSGTKHSTGGHGFYSVNRAGSIVDGCGTSYAAPNVAKTLACLEHAIEGEVSRESLIALAVHHASLPEILTNRKFKDIAKHLAGFGMPKSSDEILEGSDHAITLVFANRIHAGKKMSFSFSWPSSLVENGVCKGAARLTVVSTPPFDHRYGSEFSRINIQGYLRQQNEEGGYSGRLKPLYAPDGSEGKLEKDRITRSFKWSPIKISEAHFPKGVGPTTDWRLDVEPLARDGVYIPETGVPFTAMLTIYDPAGKKPVFTDMRQTLQSLGVQIVDIKTAARIVPRV
jgi:hypothetical protein